MPRAVGDLAASIVEAAEAGDLVMVRVMARALGELVTGVVDGASLLGLQPPGLPGHVLPALT